MEKIVLTPLEIEVLKKCAKRKFNPYDASEEEQDAHISLIDKALDFEEANGLEDERMDFTEDCNLLVWFHYKYINQGE